MQFIVDFILLAVCIIGLTAFLGIITHSSASLMSGKKRRQLFAVKSKGIQAGWRKVQKRET